jgi:hypothetical protein
VTGDAAVAQLTTASAGTPNTTSCVYIDKAAGGSSATIIMEAVPGGVSGSVLQAALAQSVRSGNAHASAVSGIGDSAFKEVTADSAGIVFAKGNTLVIIGASSSTRTGATMEPDLEGVARQVASSV